jgi:hypothetical protein
MSFITKLLRKTEPLTTATGETAPLDARALLADAAERAEAAPAPQADDSADDTRADEPAPADRLQRNLAQQIMSQQNRHPCRRPPS